LNHPHKRRLLLEEANRDKIDILCAQETHFRWKKEQEVKVPYNFFNRHKGDICVTMNRPIEVSGSAVLRKGMKAVTLKLKISVMRFECVCHEIY
ncbi:Hypothetical predicted protein, partial [Pelobates cultripes]